MYISCEIITNEQLIELFRYHRNYFVYTYMISFVSYQSLKDVESNCYIKILKLKKPIIRKSAISYLHRIIRSCSIDYLRECNSKIKSNIIDDLDCNDFYSSKDDFELRDIIKYVLDIVKLKEKDQIIFQKFFCEGYKQEEIAKELGIEKNNVKIRVFRIREKLRPLLSNLLFN